MRIIKPLRLGLLTRPYTMRRRRSLGVSVLALATLDEAAVLLPEAQLWRLASDALEEDNVLDLAVPKPCAEFLVSGRAWAYDDGQAGSAAVKARVAGCEKSLIVHGDRRAGPAGISRPAPVQGVPVDWSRAYGGADYEENPVGRGAGRLPDGTWELPNVESLNQRISRPGQTGRPASFGPVSPIRPRRFRRSGDYDPAWLENGFPGFPDTLDPHFFNAAEPDQWLARQDAFEPGSEYAIWNMHPEHACVQGRLPQWQARCFILRHGQENPEEIAMRHTTAWFFPEEERVILMFHGAAPTQEDDASDIAVIMPALDADAHRARPLAHFARVLKQRLAPESGPLHAFRDKDLLPAEALRDSDFINAETLNGPLVINQRERARLAREDAGARITAVGKNPADYGLERSAPPEPASLDELPELARRMRRQSRVAKVEMLRKRRDAEKQVAERLGDGPSGSVGRSAVETAGAEPPGGPPRFNNSLQARAMMVLAEDAQQARQVAAVGPTMPGPEQQPGAGGQAMGPAEVKSMLDHGQEGMNRLYRASAHLQAPAPVALGGRSLRMRRRVEALMQGSRDLSGLDLTGVDLAGMDLSGARGRGVLMEMADLSGVNLQDADLSEAVLTRAQLHGARLDGAVLTNANLGGAQARGASLRRVAFEASILDGAEFSDCDFGQAVFRQCAAAGVNFTDCRYPAARFHTVTFFQESSFERASFAAAELERVVWLDCVLDAVEFPDARLTACAWVQSHCERPLRFEHSHLKTCCAVQTDLPGAVFSHAWLQECSLRATMLDGARFDGARLQASDLSESSLRAAVFRGCDAEGSLLMSCDLSGADLRDSDLIDVIASGSDFRHADLSGANLFRADVSQSLLDSSTSTANTYVKWAKTLPAAPGAPA